MMMPKINVTTPVHFRVAEGIGDYWISIEIGDESIPKVLDDALISLRPRDGVSFEKVNEVAEILREYFDEFHFQHPIQQ